VTGVQTCALPICPLKTLNDYYKRNIVVLQRLNLGDKPLSAGYIMNACRIGYNQTLCTIEYGVKHSLFVRIGSDFVKLASNSNKKQG
jgi:hypothetical protein